MPRLLICEDNQRFRTMLLRTLGEVEDFEVDAVATGEDACAQVCERSPDLLLLDLELPGMDGLAVLARLQAEGSAAEVLVLTSFRDEDRIFEAMRLGAAGYLVKGVSGEVLVRSIREVLGGGSVIDATLARRFWNHFASVTGRCDVDFGLTAEELDVLRFVAKGLSNPEAADALGASTRAVKAHLASIYRKMGVGGRVAAAVLAMRCGIIER